MSPVCKLLSGMQCLQVFIYPVFYTVKIWELPNLERKTQQLLQKNTAGWNKKDAKWSNICQSLANCCSCCCNPRRGAEGCMCLRLQELLRGFTEDVPIQAHTQFTMAMKIKMTADSSSLLTQTETNHLNPPPTKQPTNHPPKKSNKSNPQVRMRKEPSFSEKLGCCS